MDASYFDWAALLTPAGAIAAVLLITQYAKAPLDKVWKIPTRVFVLVLSLLIVLGAQAFTAGVTWEALPLVLINSFVVALAAMGAYEGTFARKDEEKPPDKPL